MDRRIIFIYRERYGVRNGERLDKLNKEKGKERERQISLIQRRGKRK